MTEAEALEFFCSSRYAAAIEHSLFNVDDQHSVDSRHLEIEVAGKAIQNLKSKTKWTAEEVHPDNWGAVTSDVVSTMSALTDSQVIIIRLMLIMMTLARRKLVLNCS